LRYNRTILFLLGVDVALVTKDLVPSPRTQVPSPRISFLGQLHHTLKSPSFSQKKKNYGNLNISPLQKYIYNLHKKILSKNPKILQDIIYNSIITNLKFQHKPGKISSFIHLFHV
jgi:hypothetical protein